MPNALNTSTITTSTGTVELGTRGHPNNGVILSVSGTHSGFSIILEGTINGSTWFPLPTVRLQSGVLHVGAIALADNLGAAFYASTGVFGKVRVRASARTSGTLAVTLAASPNKFDAVANMHHYKAENIGKKTVTAAAGTTAANAVLVSSGPGILHKIVVTTAGATAGMIIYDNATTNSGTKVYSSAATHALGVYDINMPFVNGLTLRKDSTTAAFTAIYTLN